MDEKKTKILVPVDFSEASNSAIEHAIILAKKTRAEIVLLHVIDQSLIFISKGNSYNNELIESGTQVKLHQITDKIESEHKIKTDIIAVPGNIFDTINAVVSEIGANFVFMGTHGKKGIQWLKGSNALRIVYHSPVPFLLTQKHNPFPGEFNNIVFPVDSQPESAQKTDWAVFYSKVFGSKVNIFIPTESDSYLTKKIQHNLYYIKTKLQQNNVNFTVESSEKDSSYMGEEVPKYAEKIGANMIMIMLYPQRGFGGVTDFFTTPYQLKIIANPQEIPVLCINPGTLFMLQQIKI